MPLQVGLYRHETDEIFILQKGDRWCFSSGSIQEYTVSSVFEDPKAHKIYRIHGYGDTVLTQKDYETVILDEVEYTLSKSWIPTFNNIVNEDVKECLDSSDPFFVKYSKHEE